MQKASSDKKNPVYVHGYMQGYVRKEAAGVPWTQSLMEKWKGLPDNHKKMITTALGGLLGGGAGYMGARMSGMGGGRSGIIGLLAALMGGAGGYYASGKGDYVGKGLGQLDKGWKGLMTPKDPGTTGAGTLQEMATDYKQKRSGPPKSPDTVSRIPGTTGADLSTMADTPKAPSVNIKLPKIG